MATVKTSVFAKGNCLRCLIASAALVFTANVASADNVWTYSGGAVTDGEKAYAPEKAYGAYATAGDVRKAFFVQPEWAKRPGMAIFAR